MFGTRHPRERKQQGQNTGERQGGQRQNRPAVQLKAQLWRQLAGKMAVHRHIDRRRHRSGEYVFIVHEFSTSEFSNPAGDKVKRALG